jgi:hypothetical protein
MYGSGAALLTMAKAAMWRTEKNVLIKRSTGSACDRFVAAGAMGAGVAS